MTTTTDDYPTLADKRRHLSEALGIISEIIAKDQNEFGACKVSAHLLGEVLATGRAILDLTRDQTDEPA